MNYSKVIMFSVLMMTILSSSVDVQAQRKYDNRTLFTVGGDDVKVSEFEYVYNKNNISGDADYSEASLEEYLDLYVNFRLKVKEAEELGLDTVKAINDELAMYRKQLAKSYLTDSKILNDLITEAYDRSQNEIHVHHLMLQLDENAFPEDTLRVYTRMMEIRKKINKGEGFETLARMNSQDNSVKTNGGNLGYLTVFQTVYPFENAMYNAKVGTISMPVRTQFGYHLIKVDDIRKARGEIQIAQIFVKKLRKATNEQIIAAKTKAETIYEDIQSGNTSFEDHVVANSDDTKTKRNKGVMGWFATGQLYDEIDAAAFSIANVGEISKPVETNIGWHIIKLVDRKEVLPYAEMKNQLKVKVERDSRSKVAKNVMLKNIKKEYGFSESFTAKREMFDNIDNAIINGRWNAKDKSIFNKPIFWIAGNEYGQLQFINYLEINHNRSSTKDKAKLLENYYKRFIELSCFEHEENQLEKKDPDFKALMKEYRDGILLFELTDDKVWSKAIQDTAGLNVFYNKNKNNYMWDTRADAVIYTCKDEPTAAKVRKMVEKKPVEEIMPKFNKEGLSLVTYVKGKYETGQNEMVDQHGLKKGISSSVANNDGTVSFVYVKDIVNPEPKLLKEAKGYVVSDYQEFLEKEWIVELKKKFPIEIKDNVFRSLIKVK